MCYFYAHGHPSAEADGCPAREQGIGSIIKETGFDIAVSNKITRWRYAMKRKSDLTFFQKVKRSRTLLLMCTPAVLFFFAFNYKIGRAHV